jgi:hypothetical protein
VWHEVVSKAECARDYSSLDLALSIGQFGCICSFISSIASYSLTVTLFLGTIISSYSFWYLSYIPSIIRTISSVLLLIGYYALFRSNGSKLVMVYVVLFVIANFFSWIFILQYGYGYLLAYQILSAATSISLSLALAWILWTINITVSDRQLLKNIIFLTLVGLAYGYLILTPLSIFFPAFGDFSYVVYQLPGIIISLIRIVLVAQLFGKSKIIVIDDIGETTPLSSSELS